MDFFFLFWTVTGRVYTKTLLIMQFLLTCHLSIYHVNYNTFNCLHLIYL